MTKQELKYSLPLDFTGFTKEQSILPTNHNHVYTSSWSQIQISEIFKTTESHFLSTGYYKPIRNAI